MSNWLWFLPNRNSRITPRRCGPSWVSLPPRKLFVIWTCMHMRGPSMSHTHAHTHRLGKSEGGKKGGWKRIALQTLVKTSVHKLYPGCGVGLSRHKRTRGFYRLFAANEWLAGSNAPTVVPVDLLRLALLSFTVFFWGGFCIAPWKGSVADEYLVKVNWINES